MTKETYFEELSYALRRRKWIRWYDRRLKRVTGAMIEKGHFA